MTRNPRVFQNKGFTTGPFLLVFSLLSPVLLSQTYYTTDKNYLKSKTESHTILSPYQADYPDTSLIGFHNYFPRNCLGNTGLASIPFTLEYGSPNLGFRFFDAPTHTDRIKEEEIRFHHSKGPYADLTGIAGSKQLQIFKLNFTHTLKGRNNIGLKLNRYNSVGYYRKQQSFANNLLFTNSHTGKKNRFGYYGYFLANLNKNRENGGLKDSVLNDSTVWLNKGILDVRLDSAARENREFKIMFNPWLKLTKGRDSSGSADHFLSLKSTYSSHKYRYKDQGVADDNYYDTFWYDTLYTNDSAHVKKFSNTLEYCIRQNENFGSSLGFRNEYNSVWQKSDTSYRDEFFNQVIQAALNFRKDLEVTDSLAASQTCLETSADAQYIGWGLNQGNLRLEGKSCLRGLSVMKELYLDVLFEKRRPDEIYRRWNSNHFIWNNTFQDVNRFHAKTGIKLKSGLGVEVLAQSIGNFLYFDAEARPKQYSEQVQNFALNLAYSKVFFKHVGLAFQYSYQKTSAARVLRLPQNSGTVNLYFTAALFKSNMHLQLGSQLQVYQSFETYAYMPATQVFYLQNGFVTGEYPFMDVYLKVRIRPASFFVKVENILAGNAGTNFALIQGYYQPQMALRFGLSWMFFD